ncbi:MAG: 2-oxoacid:acceptor oxidoreductase subunit alpha [Oscillospiraceae bacterium]
MKAGDSVYNVLFGGAAGDGVETTAAILERVLKRSGCYVFSTRDFMSRVRGGHNFALLRIAATPLAAHRDQLDGLVVFNLESYELHKNELKEDGFILHDAALSINDARAISLDIAGMAKQAGNARTAGNVMNGALLRLFSLSTQEVPDAFAAALKPALVEVNLKALELGYNAVQPRFKLGSANTKDHILVTGAQAMSMGALAGGIKFYSAYPMSPATTVLTFLQQHQGPFEIAVEQAEDEIAALNMALGASYAGARAMVATSGGGLCLMVEAMGFAGIAEIPVVIADVQRPGSATGLPTRTEQSDLRFVISAAQGEFPRMVIAVKDQTDAFYQTARAFAIAEKYQIPVILLSDQYLADGAATVPVFDVARAAGQVKPFAAEAKGAQPSEQGVAKRYLLTETGVSPLLVPGKSEYAVCVDSDEHDEYGKITESAEVRNAMTEKRMKKLELLKAELQEPELLGGEEFDTLLVGFGSTYGAIAEAVTILRAEGKNVSALAFNDVWPLPVQNLTKYAPKAKQIINVEQNATGQLASLMREVALVGCTESLLKYDGRQISVDEIVNGVNKHLTGKGGEK